MVEQGPLGMGIVTAQSARGLASNIFGNIVGNEAYHMAHSEVERYKDGAATGTPYRWSFPVMSKVVDFYDRTVANRQRVL